MNKKLALKSALAITLSLYPLIVYAGITNYGPRLIAGLIVFLVALRYFFIRGDQSFSFNVSNGIWLVIAALIAAGTTLVTGSVLGLKFYPVLINITMLAIFSYSLIQGPSAIERLARLQDPMLDEHGVRYTRKVTIAWCLFFIANGSIAFSTVFASDKTWALYNGLISYILMGCLFAIEFCIRKIVKRRAGN